MIFTRRAFVGLSIGLLGVSRPGWAQRPTVSVFRDPSCGCCGGWVDHLRQAGYAVTVEELSDLAPVKTRLAIPEELWSCHTALVTGYAIEGHVPSHALARLLNERPRMKGLAVPGMPIGSPGMEGDREDIYEVIGFGEASRVVFGRYRGNRPV